MTPAEMRAMRLENERLRAAIEMSVRAMRAPLDGWKGELERAALDAARDALSTIDCELKESS